MYGEDSIEISPSEADEIYDQSHLIERIENVEKEISTSSICTSAFKSDYFEHPALYRVLFMGSTSEEKKKEIFKKLSQGFVHVLQHHRSNNHHAHHIATSDIHSSSTNNMFEQPITPFKEIKHNIILLSDDDAPELLSETCEDVGVSMIEADFTWNSNAIRFSNDPDNLLFKYAWDQCPNPRELPAAWMEDKIRDHKFTGFMYPEATPNGIDLCVYFYDGQDDEKTKCDLNLLCSLRKLGIYVLPLTLSRDERQKSHFADMLTEYKVRCLDLGNLEVGQEPSFQKRQQNVTQYDQVGRLQVMECTQLNVPRVATYQILAVDQFCAIENKSIFELLKRTRERQQMLKIMKEQVMLRQQDSELDKEQSDSTSTSNSTSTITTPAAATTQSTQTYWYFDHYQFIKATVVIMLIVVACSFTINKYRSTRWTVEFQVKPDFNFTVQTRNSKGLSNWSSVQPQVWMNDKHLIPIRRVDDQPGMYDLLIEYSQISSQPIVQLAFTVNTSLNQISYTTAGYPNTHFVILNPKFLHQQQNPPSQTQQQNESHQNTIQQPQQQQQQQQQQQSKQHDQQLNAKHTLKSLKFFTTNTIQNIIKIIWID
ncbi:uncharacterized protein ATC70_001206 [Mucor velutinosus]|uniref:Uncharacterized protein n=1 Tax=Mucor velutinosus TaxID=708070 RepID=A0AAN7DJD5_9FUNG|nr:hypothetical protein ATC70_001206 [Mucor velutinosus]